MKLFAIIAKMQAAIGFILIYLAASISDFYVIEQVTAEPAIVGALIKWGIVFLIPLGIYIAIKIVREGEEE